MAPHQLLARFGPRHCTESVEVPSSEHVAEIVGRQGKSKLQKMNLKILKIRKTTLHNSIAFFVGCEFIKPLNELVNK